MVPNATADTIRVVATAGRVAAIKVVVTVVITTAAATAGQVVAIKVVAIAVIIMAEETADRGVAIRVAVFRRCRVASGHRGPVP